MRITKQILHSSVDINNLCTRIVCAVSPDRKYTQYKGHYNNKHQELESRVRRSSLLVASRFFHCFIRRYIISSGIILFSGYYQSIRHHAPRVRYYIIYTAESGNFEKPIRDTVVRAGNDGARNHHPRRCRRVINDLIRLTNVVFVLLRRYGDYE